MNPHIEQKSKKGDMLSFTLSGVNVSLANAIRRTIFPFNKVYKIP